MSLTLRYMRVGDIPRVVEIDRLAFDPAWSARSYEYEISESTYSHMVVLEHADIQPVNGWRRWLRPFGGAASHLQKTVVAYGGLWNIADEAHISTIATHPDARGRGYGEIVLAGMVRRSITLEASYVVLEVRVSNNVAQNLYHKYEFEIVDRKPQYYRNNLEDAFDMRLNFDPSLIERFQQRYTALLERHQFEDLYTAGVPQR
jgi:[ribosomal protein S18]-alanine N-acetyltransferase